MTALQAVPRWVRNAVLLPVAVLASLFFLLPLWWVVVSALRPQRDIFRYLSPLSPEVLVPTEYTLDNFRNLLSGVFFRATWNSVLVAGVTVVVGLAICALAAYALAALRFRGRAALFAVIVVGFLIPFDAVAIPLGGLFSDWGLRNTYTGLILPGLGNGLAIFVLRQFFIGIPRDLREAARVDGASEWTILWRIYLPNAKPALIASGLILFVFQWQAYLWPLIIVSDDRMQLAPVVLAKLQGQAEYGFDPGQIFAGTMVLAVIPVLMLLRFQRHFVESIASSGID
jgi:putative chitobiose transport system permease protein